MLFLSRIDGFYLYIFGTLWFFQEIDFDMRAPYIPMTGDADLIFAATPVPLVHDFDDGPEM